MPWCLWVSLTRVLCVPMRSCVESTSINIAWLMMGILKDLQHIVQSKGLIVIAYSIRAFAETILCKLSDGNSLKSAGIEGADVTTLFVCTHEPEALAIASIEGSLEATLSTIWTDGKAPQLGRRSDVEKIRKKTRRLED